MVVASDLSGDGGVNDAGSEGGGVGNGLVVLSSLLWRGRRGRARKLA